MKKSFGMQSRNSSRDLEKDGLDCCHWDRFVLFKFRSNKVAQCPIWHVLHDKINSMVVIPMKFVQREKEWVVAVDFNHELNFSGLCGVRKFMELFFQSLDCVLNECMNEWIINGANVRKHYLMNIRNQMRLCSHGMKMCLSLSLWRRGETQTWRWRTYIFSVAVADCSVHCAERSRTNLFAKLVVLHDWQFQLFLLRM